MSEKLYPLKLYVRYKPNIIMFAISFILNVTSWAWLSFQIRSQSEPIFLHYNILFGVDLIGEWWKVFYVPGLGLIIFILNALVGWFLFNKDKFIAYVLNFVSVVSQVFLLIISALLVFLNV